IDGRYYSSEEIAWSRESKRRASATADAALVSAQPDPGTAAETVTAAPPPETATAVPTETDWVKRWGTQAAVGVAGLLLAAAVAWKLVF
ncbi:MAG: hypothetical protein QG656_2626, partial [Candidatus Hydrogenedentes bacterium]|nr:hypothetical protein [Candidatus Hydrogenedentota bacterium]